MLKWIRLVIFILGVFQKPTLGGDFNGDGFDDLVIGAPGEGIESAGLVHAGAVHVVFGSANGLSSANDVFFVQSDFPLAGGGPANDNRFGSVVASGDFDGDGYSDLAIAAPGQGFLGEPLVGVVHVIAGGPTGFDTSSKTTLVRTKHSISSKTTAKVSKTCAGFGYALAAGDFDGDGRDDLAIGFIEQKPNLTYGAIAVVPGSSTGLRTKKTRIWTLESKGVAGKSTIEHGFGGALAAGDFDGDGITDLAIGTKANAASSSVTILRGGNKGLTSKHIVRLRDVDALPLGFTGVSLFGSALCATDMNGDGIVDLAVGAPQSTDPQSSLPTGVCYVYLGQPTGVQTTPWQTLAAGAADDRMGAALGGGDFDGDGFGDLVIGAPLADSFSAVDCGNFRIAKGSAIGISLGGAVIEGSQLVPGTNLANTRLGAAILGGDFNGDGSKDCAVSIPFDATSGAAIGSVRIFDGYFGIGLAPSSTPFLDQDTGSIQDAGEADDEFGAALG